jgi:hypothetical protein
MPPSMNDSNPLCKIRSGKNPDHELYQFLLGSGVIRRLEMRIKHGFDNRMEFAAS